VSSTPVPGALGKLDMKLAVSGLILSIPERKRSYVGASPNPEVEHMPRRAKDRTLTLHTLQKCGSAFLTISHLKLKLKLLEPTQDDVEQTTNITFYLPSNL
jgi:hypothetical protein